MSTQYTDHDTLERPVEQAPTSRPAPRNPDRLDHHRLAREWLLREESIAALRVADPSRGRFTPWRETPDADLPQRWVPTSRRNMDIDRLCRDYRLLLTIHAERTIWRRPYSPRD